MQKFCKKKRNKTNITPFLNVFLFKMLQIGVNKFKYIEVYISEGKNEEILPKKKTIQKLKLCEIQKAFN
jgi:hypothetical protein